MKYALFINFVLYDYFKSLKEIDIFLFDLNLDINSSFIEVKKVKLCR